MLQLVLVDEGVVDAIDVVLAQHRIVDVLRAAIVGEAERLEEVHVDHRRPGGDDRVDHVVADQVDVDLHAAGGAGAAGDGQDDRAVRVLQHALVDLARAPELARAERHLLEGVDQRARVMRGDVDVLDGPLQKGGLLLSLPVHGDELRALERRQPPAA